MIGRRSFKPYWRLALIQLPIFVIYERPKDFPDGFIVRLWNMQLPTTQACTAGTLADARDLIPKGLVRLPRVEGDDINVVEVWF